MAGKVENMIAYVREFLGRFSAKVSVSPDPSLDYSLSFGISPKDTDADEMLESSSADSIKEGVHIVVCIDEFQQIGEFPDSLTVQKRLRGVWQHQENVSYCLFGSNETFDGKDLPEKEYAVLSIRRYDLS